MQKNYKRLNLLITGGAGYLGSKITTNFVMKGHQVTVIDKLDFNKSSLNHLFCFKNFTLIKDDVRKKKLLKKILKQKDFIFPLAGIVGAPLCDLRKKDALEVNQKNIEFIIDNIKKDQKIIYPTTNSGYGIGEKTKFCDETTPLNPISLYGRTKVEAEKIILQHDNSISLRLATVFGYSYRMRTDLLVNNFVETAIKKKKLDIFEPNFRRNYIHVEDVVNAFNFAVQNFHKMKGKIYNIGLSSANLTKLMLARNIKKHIKGLKIKIITNKTDPDKRDYYVSNKKIEKLGFKTKFSLDDGIEELINVLSYSENKIKNNYKI